MDILENVGKRQHYIKVRKRRHNLIGCILRHEGLLLKAILGSRIGNNIASSSLYKPVPWAEHSSNETTEYTYN